MIQEHGCQDEDKGEVSLTSHDAKSAKELEHKRATDVEATEEVNEEYKGRKPLIQWRMMRVKGRMMRVRGWTKD